MLIRLLDEYTKQYPEDDSLDPMIFSFGIKKTEMILMNRNGRRIILKSKEGSRDHLEYEYSEN